MVRIFEAHALRANFKAGKSELLLVLHDSFRALRVRVFEEPQIPIATRTRLANSLIFSRLFYNCAIWSPLERLSKRALQHGYVSVMRAILRAKNKPDAEHTSDKDIVVRAR